MKQWKYNKDRLVALREAHGMSQDTLAEKIGTSKQHVSRWETGELVPSTQSLVKICNVFGITPQYFFTDK